MTVCRQCHQQLFSHVRISSNRTIGQHLQQSNNYRKHNTYLLRGKLFSSHKTLVAKKNHRGCDYRNRSKHVGQSNCSKNCHKHHGECIQYRLRRKQFQYYFPQNNGVGTNSHLTRTPRAAMQTAQLQHFANFDTQYTIFFCKGNIKYDK